MGFETIASQMILIGSFIYFAVILTNTVNDNWYGIYSTIKEHNDRMAQDYKEQISIYNMSYDVDQNITRIKIKNQGATKINYSFMDFFIDSDRIPRNNSNRTMQMFASTDIKNPGLWDPDETLIVNIEKHLDSGNHYVEAFTSNANHDLIQYEVI